MALCWTLDKLGPMGRTRRRLPARPRGDCRARSGRPDERRSAPSGTRRGRSRGASRSAIPKGAAEWSQPEVMKNFEASVKVLESFADVVRDVVLPDLPVRAHDAARSSAAEGARGIPRPHRVGRFEGPARRRPTASATAGRCFLAVDYIQALRLRERARAPMNKFFEGLDAVAAPTRPTVALPIGMDFDKAYPELAEGRPQNFVSPIGTLIQAGNAVGFPALSVPERLRARGPSDGTPVTWCALSGKRPGADRQPVPVEDRLSLEEAGGVLGESDSATGDRVTCD